MPVPDPADYGFCAQKQSIYLMTRWIEGESLPLCLPEQSAVDQYMLGHQAAVTLYALHGCQAPHTGKNWWHQLKQDTDDLLLQIGSEKNAAAPIHQLTGFVDKNREFAMHQPSVLLHGDLQPDNMLLSNDQTVSFIDFTQWHFGDPLSDVATAIAGISQISPHFATGLLDAYFNYHVTTKTFRLLALYGAINCLQHYCQACRCGDGEQERALLEINHFMKTCNSLQSVVPEWYEPMPQIRVHSD